MTEKPLDSLSIGLVAELTGELENPGGADYRHANAAASAVDLAVAVLGGRLLHLQTAVGCGGASQRGQRLFLRRINNVKSTTITVSCRH